MPSPQVRSARPGSKGWAFAVGPALLTTRRLKRTQKEQQRKHRSRETPVPTSGAILLFLHVTVLLSGELTWDIRATLCAGAHKRKRAQMLTTLGGCGPNGHPTASPAGFGRHAYRRTARKALQFWEVCYLTLLVLSRPVSRSGTVALLDDTALTRSTSQYLLSRFIFRACVYEGRAPIVAGAEVA